MHYMAAKFCLFSIAVGSESDGRCCLETELAEGDPGFQHETGRNFCRYF